MSSKRHAKLIQLASQKIAKLEAELNATKEPIAIIGMGCRFPGGANDPEAYWQILKDGVDAVTEIPRGRWDVESHDDSDPDAPDTMNVRQGAFLDYDIAGFDAHFFGIAPREAMSMDPQQRLLLEVAWEALEHAGLSADEMTESLTGVYIGLMNTDYFSKAMGQLSTEAPADPYLGTGNGLSFPAGRLSYILGLQGPSMVVATACSSSLVSIHLACQALRAKECDYALAGGVHLILSQHINMILSEMGALAPDGRCKTFSAQADGYGRGEGCGIVVLKRLSDAQAAGDHILALIRGSAVNHDGPSGGLTVPNGPAQEQLLRRAYASAKIKPEAVSYLEAHGTGTSLGDPIELRALAKVMGKRQSPLLIGSAKTNIGHLEAAAGIAALIKVVQALQHEQLPPHLHFDEPNPHIPWDKWPLNVPTELTAWPREASVTGRRSPSPSELGGTEGGRRRIAGVSSFGLSGINAHLIVEEAACPPRVPPNSGREAKGEQILTLSAKTEAALHDLARRYERYIEEQPAEALADICQRANTTRTSFRERLAISASSKEEILQKLATFATGRERTGIVSGRSTGRSLPVGKSKPQIAFLFTGQGSQYIDMGRQLYETEPLFRQTLEQCDELLQPYLEYPLLSVLYPHLANDQKSKIENRKSKILHQTAYTQPALFALEYALAQLWKSWGIEPDVVMGHSVGEYVAACVAGVFSLEDGLKLIAERGRLMQALPASGGHGQMVAVWADSQRVQAALRYQRHVSIAAINGPENVVISGKSQEVQAIVTRLEAEGIRTKRLQVSHAFHSPLMQPILRRFEQAAKRITYSAPRIKIVSNVTGQLASVDKMAIASPSYWVRHVRAPVRFADGMATLQEEGYDAPQGYSSSIFVEIGPKPTLLGMARHCLPDYGTYLPSLRPGRGDGEQMLESLAELYVRGMSVNWAGFYTASSLSLDPGSWLALPTYPWQRKRYWLDLARSEGFSPPKSVGQPQGAQPQGAQPQGLPLPFIGQKLTLPLLTDTIFESHFSTERLPILLDHRVYGQVVVPGASYIELLLEANQVMGSKEHTLTDLLFQQPLIIPEEGERTVQLMLTPRPPAPPNFGKGIASGEETSFKLISFENSSPDEWVVHLEGRIEENHKASSPKSHQASSPPRPQGVEVSRGDFYETLRQRQIELGHSFQWVESIWKGEREVLAQLRQPDTVLDADAYQLHPGLLDSCFQLLAVTFPSEGEEAPWLLWHLAEFRLHAPCPPGTLWCYAKQVESEAGRVVGEIQLFDEAGQLIAELIGFELRQASASAPQGWRDSGVRGGWQAWLYEVEWQAQARFEPSPVVDYLPPAHQISESIEKRLPALFAAEASDVFHQLEALSVEYILNALHEMGETYQSIQGFSSASLALQLGIVPQQKRLFARLLEILADEVIPTGHDITTSVVHAPTKGLKSLLLGSAERAELTLLKRCGSRLAELLRGECDPLDLLFPDGDLTLLTAIYRDSPEAEAINTIVREALLTAQRHLPIGRGMRVLEIGAGTGGTTAYLLPHLDPERTEYTFSDISSLFIAKAQETFADYAFMRYQPLDIEQAPEGQGFTPHHYDLIIAANVLHATRELRVTLSHVHQLLAPGGMLVLVEATSRQRWLDLTFGLTEGWWGFQDFDLRPNHPLLSIKQWQELLQESGFSDVASQVNEPVALEGSQDSKGEAQQAVILAMTPPQRAPKAEHWLIFAEHTHPSDEAKGLGEQLASLLATKGIKSTLAFAGTAYQKLPSGNFGLEPSNPAHFEQLLSDPLLADVQHIVQMWPLESSTELTISSLERATTLGSGSSLLLLQALTACPLGIKQGLPAKLWFITRGTQPIVGATFAVAQQSDISQASLWGIGKTIALEHPELWGGLIDLAPQTTPEDDSKQLAALLDEIWYSPAATTEKVGAPLAVAHHDKEIAFRNGQRYVPRLKPLRVDDKRLANEQETWQINAESTYLITGGLGTLGLKVADFLVKEGARHLILMGRSKPANIEIIKPLEEQGAQIYIAQADVTKEADLRRLLVTEAAERPPLRGIVHTAAVFGAGYQLLAEMSLEDLNRVLAPKVIGTALLHQLTSEMEMDFFVCFSSMVSIWGSKGQANYVAANQFLDMFAHYARGMGHNVLSVNWGLWAESEQTLLQGDFGQLWGATEMGVNLLKAKPAFEALKYLLKAGHTQTTVADIDWHKYKPLLESKGKLPLLAEIATARSNDFRSSPSAHVEQPFIEQFNATRLNERQELLRTHIQEQLRHVLGPIEQLDSEQGFFDMGMDSLMAIALRNRLQKSLGISLRSTLAFDFPTIETLAEHLGEELSHVLSEGEADEENYPEEEFSEDEAPGALPLQGVVPHPSEADLLAESLAEVEALLGLI